MNEQSISQIFSEQKKFFATGFTQEYQPRLHILNKLKEALKIFHEDILKSAYADFKRIPAEVELSEIHALREEIDYALKNFACWANPHKVPLGFLRWGSRAQVFRKPYGVVLILAPWNFPFVLSLLPAMHALAAGNAVIIKPSELAPAQAECIQKIIEFIGAPYHCSVIMGDAQVAQELLTYDFDYILFTGSTRVGKLVYQAAAQKLIPVTLELGGKCPALIAPSADINRAAKSIIWGKFFNAGQTCIAPDYVVVHDTIHEQFLKTCLQVLIEFYGDDPQTSTHYGRIVNTTHVIRLQELLQHTHGQVIGGRIDLLDKYCQPTLVNHVTFDDALMQEEIFGPILPILSYRDFSQMLRQLSILPKPLAIYAFTHTPSEQTALTKQLSAGSYVFNDVLAQAQGPTLPFGGVGASGFGRYHGHYGFETFSRPCIVYQKKIWWFDNLFRPPYLPWIQKFLKFF